LLLFPMATAAEEVAPAVAVAPAPEKVAEVKEAADVETPEKVEDYFIRSNSSLPHQVLRPSPILSPRITSHHA